MPLFPSPTITANNPWLLDMLDLKKRIDALQAGAAFDHQFVDGMLQSASQLEDDLKEEKQRAASMPDAHLALGPPQGLPIIFGEEKYTEIHDPVLAIFASLRISTSSGITPLSKRR